MEADSSKPQTAEDWAFEAGKRYKTSVRFVLISLARCIDKENNCPSHKDLSEMTGVSKDTVRRALGELEKDGLVAIVKNGGGKVKGGQKDCYELPKYTRPAYTQDTGSMVHTGTLPIGKTQSPEHDQSETSTSEYVRVGSDAATRVNDLSEKQKTKDKKPFSPAVPGESKKVPKQSNRPPRERNPLFDAIAAHIFDFLPTSTEAINKAAPRIGEMLRDFPADKTALTAERIAHFGRWWNANKKGPDGKPISKPLTAAKLAKHWSDFERVNPLKTAESQQTAQARQAESQRELEQEHRRIQREMLGMTV